MIHYHRLQIYCTLKKKKKRRATESRKNPKKKDLLASESSSRNNNNVVRVFTVGSTAADPFGFRFDEINARCTKITQNPRVSLVNARRSAATSSAARFFICLFIFSRVLFRRRGPFRRSPSTASGRSGRRRTRTSAARPSSSGWS